MNTYTWKISSLDCKPSVGDLENYVVTAHWRCNGEDANNHVGTVYSTVSFEVDSNKPNYIPFDQLTEEMVTQWVQNTLGEEQVAAIHSSIDNQIENQINPPIINPTLPWIN